MRRQNRSAAIASLVRRITLVIVGLSVSTYGTGKKSIAALGKEQCLSIAQATVTDPPPGKRFLYVDIPSSSTNVTAQVWARKSQDNPTAFHVCAEMSGCDGWLSVDAIRPIAGPNASAIHYAVMVSRFVTNAGKYVFSDTRPVDARLYVYYIPNDNRASCAAEQTWDVTQGTVATPSEILIPPGEHIIVANTYITEHFSTLDANWIFCGDNVNGTHRCNTIGFDLDPVKDRDGTIGFQAHCGSNDSQVDSFCRVQVAHSP